MKVQVNLNGTKVNPYKEMGFTQNPFPAIPHADARFTEANRILADLDAEPIINVVDLRERLKGCDAEFIELCVGQFQKGKRVKFTISFPDPSDDKQ